MHQLEDLLDLKQQLKKIEELYPTITLLDTDGNIINENIKVNLTDTEAVQLMKDMVWARELNTRCIKFAKQGRLGFYAPTEGQEASQMGTAMNFQSDDRLYGAYRDIPQLVKHGLPLYKAFLWSKGHAIGSAYEEELHAIPPQIIIGAQYIQGMGAAMALKREGKPNVVYTYTGDGGTSQGDFYEGINYAGAYKLPIVFFVQNNGYAISTPRYEQTSAATLSQKAAAAGIPGISVNGMDAMAVYEVARVAREWAVNGNGPILVEIICNRFGPHSMSGDDPTIYRDKEDIELWKKYDPLIRFRKFLETKGLWNESIESNFIDQANNEITEAMTRCESVPKQKISDFLKNTFEVPGENIKEQIKIFEEKENR